MRGIAVSAEDGKTPIGVLRGFHAWVENAVRMHPGENDRAGTPLCQITGATQESLPGRRNAMEFPQNSRDVFLSGLPVEIAWKDIPMRDDYIEINCVSSCSYCCFLSDLLPPFQKASRVIRQCFINQTFTVKKNAHPLHYILLLHSGAERLQSAFTFCIRQSLSRRNIQYSNDLSQLYIL